MIVKVQMDSTGSKVLIYSRTKAVLVQVSADAVKRLAMKPLDKLYATASVDQGGVLRIGRRVSDRLW
jgi:hypothetical protein